MRITILIRFSSYTAQTVFAGAISTSMATSKEESSLQDEKEEIDEINLFSSNFDPLRALYAQNVSIPSPAAPSFDNVSSFSSFMLRQESSQLQSSDSASGSESQPQSQEPHQKAFGKGRGRMKFRDYKGPLVENPIMVESNLISNESRRDTRRYKNVLTRMKEKNFGPLDLLTTCLEKRCKVRVAVRTFKGLRGVCIGYVEAFDKMLNLAMVDVDEVYRKPPLGKRFYHEEILSFGKVIDNWHPQPKSTELLKTVPQNKNRNRKERKMRLLARLAGTANENPKSVNTSEKTTKISQTSTKEPVARISENISRTGDRAEGQKEKNTAGEAKISEDNTPKKKGKMQLKPEEFLRRHVNQLFLRGDNVILISVDSSAVR